MRYEGEIYRPPSEWDSYLLQVTIGCSHNACTFCGMFKGKRYHTRPLQEVLEDIALAGKVRKDTAKVFLCDGDAIALPTSDLLKIIGALKEAFPKLRSIATYAGPRSTLAKSREELQTLRKAGLNRTYLGVETGDDATLAATCKGVDAAGMLEAGRRLADAGMDLFAIVLIGLAGKERSLANARATANLINRMRPSDLAAMTYTPVPGTKMYADIKAGRFKMLSDQECLSETRELVREITAKNLHFTSNHASNPLPIHGMLPRDKGAILQLLDAAIAGIAPTRARTARGL